MRESLKVFEAFAGVGCQHQALKNINIDFEVVGISEIDKYAIKSYEALHGKVKNYGDISKIEPSELPDFDLFTFSFPCQDISNSGYRLGFEKGSNTRSSLLWECEKIIKEKRPKYLLMENVKNLVGKKFIECFTEWLKILEGYGYTNYWKVLNAKDYGVPQNRERVFCISILGEHKPFEFPEREELKVKLKDLLEDHVDEKYFLNEEQIKRIHMSTYHAAQRRIQEKDWCDTLCARDWKDPKCVKVEQIGRLSTSTRDNSQRYRVYSSEGLSPTLNTMQGGGLHPHIVENEESSQEKSSNYRIRKLTPRECWRLMGFSDKDIDKAFSGGCSNSQLYKQAGNGIVVTVLERLFENLLN